MAAPDVVPAAVSGLGHIRLPFLPLKSFGSYCILFSGYTLKGHCVARSGGGLPAEGGPGGSGRCGGGGLPAKGGPGGSGRADGVRLPAEGG